jgi:hypothetical protein
MPAYNFNPIFASPVECGWKKQTIRAKRKNRPRVGQTSYCFTGMRTKKCQRLGAWEILRVVDVHMLPNAIFLDGQVFRHRHNLDSFAKKDGFHSWVEMRIWFNRTHGLPFNGDLVLW